MQGLLLADVVPPGPAKPAKKGCSVAEGDGAGGLVVVALLLALGRRRRRRR